MYCIRIYILMGNNLGRERKVGGVGGDDERRGRRGKAKVNWNEGSNCEDIQR